MNDAAHAARGRVAPLSLAVAAFVVVVDQLTKWWAVSTLDDRNIDLVWTLRFNLSFNTGMAFGTGRSMGPIIAVVAMVVVVGLLLSLRRGTSRTIDVSIGMILGGAVGNLIDRLVRDPGWFRGGVVDFIDFQWFPIFNVADMGITVGGALLVLASWRIGSQTAGEVEPTATTSAGAEDVPS
jgi:signal peptidase II